MHQETKFYKERVVSILSNFQLLELALKIYIGKSYELIQHLVGSRIHFDFSVSDVESYPLERQLNLFGKLNDNESLKTRLNKLKSKRNFVAHEALLVTISGNPDVGLLSKNAMDLFHLEDELVECLKLLTKEGKNLLARFAQRSS
ncbi:hypothetical protein [Rhodoferax sp. TS-BS-61-7]|uniref:hypothetical protein n=1 Tax=Rhodoferax sp. TS-BS-61-7 TaxID=2094194 RepID=UPI000CF6CA16|nr:hypothetical protein [Rhodoferax sp. TS-BS-61-7]PQA78484.1 hypothetical protein C5F53_00380 [Rhodoferax sp. TS-BS-61-7]